MCFQGFVHCSCGHISLLETTCDLAADIPFYIKVACPKYQFSSITPNRACGVGKFYCRETREGRFLEQVYQMFENTAAELSHINDRSKSFDAVLAKFNQSADDVGVSREARKQHSAYHRISGRIEALHQQRDQVTVKRMAIASIIQEGYKYYLRRAEDARNGVFTVSRPFTLPRELRSLLPIEMQAQLDALAAPGTALQSSVADQIIDVSDKQENIYITPRHRGYVVQNIQWTPGVIEAQGGTTMSQTTKFEDLPNLQKQNQPKRLIEEDRRRSSADAVERNESSTKTPSLLRESSNVRRSARIRDKKVTYAESEASTDSRAVSPEKSDGDNFTPTNSDRDDFSASKSDASPSPEKAIRRRRRSSNLRKEMSGRNYSTFTGDGNSLSSLMDDWKRRNTTVPTVPPGQNQKALGIGADNYSTIQANTNILAGKDLSTGAMATLLPRMIGRSQVAAYGASTGAKPPQGWRPSTRQESSSPAAFITGLSNPIIAQPLSGMNQWSGTRVSRSPYVYEDDAARPETLNTIHQTSRPQAMLNQTNSNRLWPINTPPSNGIAKTAAPPGLAHVHHATGASMERHDSAIGAPVNSGFHASSSSNLNYDRLRRSFSATADLTPPTNEDLKSTNTDPQKRSLPASSPLLPSSKRIRLSLPGKHMAGVRGDGLPQPVTGSMSSPSKMATQQLPESRNVKQSAATEEPPVTPAPILAPTAVMYMSQNQQEVGEEGFGDRGVNVTDETSNQANMEDRREYQFSDIDWSLINDDFS